MATSGLYGSSPTGATVAAPGSESAGLYGNATTFGGSYFEWFIFIQSETQPATPTGGSWSFTTNSGTPPTGWSSTPPSAPTLPVWVSIALVNSKNTTALVWSAPGLFSYSSGLPILSGTGEPLSGDGLTNQLYIQTSTTPETIWFKQAGTWTRLTGSTLYADLTSNQTIAGTKTFSSEIQGSISGTASNVTGIVGISNGGTGSTTANGALTALGGIGSLTSTDGSVTITSPTATSRNLAVVSAGSTTNVLCQVRNATGATLTKGTVVYISGATGQIPTVSKALATSDATSAQTLGMMTADLANNSNGYVTVIGLINDIDTSAYSDGAQLYLSGTTAGTVTATKPYAPIHLVYVAVVEYAHPTQGKLFVKVQNGYELDEIHNVSAQTPSNGQTIVYNTSTGLWTQNTVSLAIGVNGTLPIANGGTGQTTANAALNALLPTQTGNASKYLQTDGTNATWDAISLSTADITGILPVANGGTGLSTLTAGYIPFGSGTSAFGSSANLFWDSANARLGIGTSSPALKLDVSFSSAGDGIRSVNTLSTGFADVRIGNNTNANLAYLRVGGSAQGGISQDCLVVGTGGGFPIKIAPQNAVTATFDVAGNLGLGVTPSTGWDTATPALQVKGRLALSAYLGNAYISNNLYNSSAGWKYLTANPAAYFRMADNQYMWYQAPTGTIDTLATLTQAMTLDASGNLLVGKTSASIVNTGAEVTNSGFYSTVSSTSTNLATNNGGKLNLANISATDGNFSNIGAYNSNGLVVSQIDFINVSHASRTGDIAFLTHNGTSLIERVRIDSAGNVGIGTSSPAVKLDISGTAQTLFKLTTTNTEANINFNINSSTNNFFGITGGANFFWNTGGSERMRLDASGNLGIGTTNPLQKLVVSNNGGAGLEISPTAIASSPSLVSYNRSGAAYTQLTASALLHVWQNSGTEVARIDTSGNLLVGTTTNTNTSKLVVNGTISQTVGGTQYLVVDQSDIGTGANEIPLNQYLGNLAYEDNTNLPSVGVGAGTAALPSIFNATDKDTGFWFPAANTIAASVNGAEGLRLTTTGLGIGTSSPAAKLESVQGTSGAGGWYMAGQFSAATASMVRIASTGGNKYISIGNDSDGAFHLFVNGSSGVVGTEAAILNASGNLGLGVTPSAWGSSYKVIDIGGGASIAGLSNNTYIATNAYDNGTNYIYKATAAATLYLSTAGQHRWYNAPSGTAGTVMSLTQAMTLDASGNLLVGRTSTPADGLARIAVANTTDTAIQLTKNGVISCRVTAVSSGLAFGVDGSDGATERMRIDSSGNLLVGTTTQRGVAKTTIEWSGGSNNGLVLNNTTGTGTPNHINFMWTNSSVGQIASDGTNLTYTSTGATIFTTNSAERARIDSSGNLLVGTTSNSVTSGVGHKIRPDAAAPFMGTVGSSTAGGDVTYTLYSTGAAAYRFYVGYNGTISATTTTISAISDIRFKENVRDLDAGLSKIMALKPRLYDWKEGKGANIKNARGFIAQEFEEVFPDLIDEWKDPAPEGEAPYKAVRQDLIPVLVKAIQELKTEFDAYKASHP